MREKLQHALDVLDNMERTAHGQSPLHRVDPRAKLLTTVVLLITMLSLPLANLSGLLLYFIAPLLLAAQGGLRYGTLFRRSLIVLPFVALIGIFNPLYDRAVAFTVGGWAISEGWISFCSILLRGILSVQVLLILIDTTGIYALCRSLQRMGVPALLTTQLLFVYRYLYVLIGESMRMMRARDARSFGRRSYPLSLWSRLIGQLLIRSFNRAERIDNAMRARGFSGEIPEGLTAPSRWRWRDTFFAAGWCALFLVLRIWQPTEHFRIFLQP